MDGLAQSHSQHMMKGKLKPSQSGGRVHLYLFIYSFWVYLYICYGILPIFAVVQLLSCVQLFAIPWTAENQAFLSLTISQSLLKWIQMPIESVTLSNHLILCCPFLLLPSVFPTIRVFSNESALLIRWPKYWSFSFSISASNEYSELISFRID